MRIRSCFSFVLVHFYNHQTVAFSLRSKNYIWSRMSLGTVTWPRSRVFWKRVMIEAQHWWLKICRVTNLNTRHICFLSLSPSKLRTYLTTPPFRPVVWNRRVAGREGIFSARADCWVLSNDEQFYCHSSLHVICPCFRTVMKSTPLQAVLA